MRHPRPQVAAGTCYGSLDLDLVPGYEMLIPGIKEQLPQNIPVFTSPLRRCRIPANLFSQNPVVDSRIAEMHFGDWEGMRWDDLKGTEASSWMRNYLTQRTPNGESFQDLRNRVMDFLENAIPIDFEAVLLVTHAGVIRALMIELQQQSPRKVFTTSIEFAALYRFRYDRPSPAA
ncbi:MAG: histidine phosphatase family protein [Leptospirales bacterium]|nr:histidine phosphatase family protein [Leptospirales bacterium]